MSTDDPTRPDDAPSSEVAETGDASSPVGRRDAVREKAQLVHAQQSRARLVRRSALIAGTVAAVAVVGVVVTWAVSASANRPQLSPTSAHEDGFVVSQITGTSGITSPDDPAPTPTEVPAADATAAAEESSAVHIDVYVDYLSPQARDWQLANKTQLSSWVSEGAATLSYHPIAMLTAKSNGTKYSLRAASAAACVATYAPASFFSFNDDLLNRQPAMDSDGFSDAELANIALANGSDDPTKLRECIETQQYASWVKGATERAIAGIEGTKDLALTGTSMITVDGQAYVGSMTDPAEFSQFVLTTASGNAKSASPSPTPSPTPTP